MTRLCDKSAITVGKFKNASTTVLGSLKATYEFLMENFEDMAIDTLADVAETAKGMATAAEELRADFDNQAKKVVEALEKTQRTHDTQEKNKKKLEEERKEMESEQAKQERLEQQAAEAQRKAEAMARAADNKENEAVQAIMNIREEESNTSFWTDLANAITGKSAHIAATLNASLRTQEDKAKAAREEKMKQLMLMQQKEEMRSKALAEIAAYMKCIKSKEKAENEIKEAIDALLIAIRALKSLSAVMMQAALFWYQLQEHCEFLAKGEMKEMIEKALKYPEERRLKFWNSKGFKTKAVTYYAGWVALDHVCGIYMERIMLTQRELYTYIQEAYTKEDAQKTVKELADKFLVDLDSQQKAIAERKETQLKEMEELKEKGKKADEEAAAKKDAK